LITVIPPKSAHLGNLLRYLNRGDERRRLLMTNLQSRDPAGWQRQIDSLAEQYRPNLQRYVKHLLLSFPPGETLSEETLGEIVPFYLARMGYGDAPYVAFLHDDQPHQHVHIVTTPVTFAGEKISESWDWPRSERVARKIERRWELRPVASSKRSALRAVATGEHHAAGRAGEPSLRAQFQRDVVAAGKASDTLPEFVDRLEQQGYEVRLRFDREERLRGLSFARGDGRFTGSKLGRALTGNRLLSTFSLAYDAERDRAALEARPPRLEVPPPSARPDRPVPPGEHGPLGEVRMALELPEGTYQLAGVRPQALAEASGRIGRRDIEWHRTGWNPEQIRAARGYLESQSQQVEVLIRPQEENASILGFRGVRPEQLAAMQSDGYEPALTVQVGDHFDIALRTHELLTPDEKGALRDHLVTTYALPDAKGVYRDALRMPGLAGPAVGDATDRRAAVLIGTQEGPFPGSQGLTEQLRFVARRQEVERLVGRYQVPAEIDAQPTASLREVLEPRIGFPDSSPLAAVQEQVLAAREQASSLPSTHLGALNNEELISRLTEANAVVLASAQGRGGAPTSESVQELLQAETEVAQRRSSWLGGALRAERELTEVAGRLERAQERVDQAPSQEATRAYREELASYQESAARLDRLETGVAELSYTQAVADRQRHAAALVGSQREEDFAQFHRRVEREVELGERSSKLKGRALATDSLDQLSEKQQSTALLEGSLRWDVRNGLAHAAEPYGDVASSRVQLGRSADRTMHHQSVAEAGGRFDASRQATLSTFLDYSRDLGRDAEKAAVQAGRSGSVQQLAQAVSEGDLSPGHLRRLNGAIVLAAEAGQLPAPSFTYPKDPDQLVGLYRQARPS
jgi:hypothetical protein